MVSIHYQEDKSTNIQWQNCSYQQIRDPRWDLSARLPSGALESSADRNYMNYDIFAKAMDKNNLFSATSTLET